ncbi:hypothetical protein EXQ41_06345 [Clostridium botulinum]|nr:hypothetical protein [Clostridium botulinum]MBO0555670.1 hypothetical protein [Clostridium botulinum]
MQKAFSFASKYASKTSEIMSKSNTRVATMAQNTGSKITGLYGKIAAVGATIGAAKIGKTMISQAGDMEAYRNTLNVVMKDTQKAGKMFAWATNFANKTPFETDDVVQATVRLQSYGLEAQKLIPTVGDMASVMNTDLMSAVEAVADAQTGELERLKSFGITKDMIQKQAKSMNMDVINNKGQITDLNKFNQALETLMKNRFGGGMEKQAKTFKGAMSTVTGVAKNSLAQIAGIAANGDVKKGSLFDILTKGAIGLGNTLQNLADSGIFNKISAGIGNGLSFILKIFSGGSIGLVTKFFNELSRGASVSHGVFMSLKNVLGEGMADTISSLVGYVEFGTKGILAFLQGDLSKAGDMFYAMFPDEGETQGKVSKIISFLQTASSTFTSVFGTVKNVASSIFTGIGSILSAAAPYISQFIGSILNGVQQILPYVSSVVSTIGTGIVTLIPIISSIINFVVSNVLPILSRLVQFITTYIVPVIVNTFNAIVPRIISILQSLWAFLQPFLQNIMTVIAFVMPFIQQAVLVAINLISGVLRGLFQILDGIIAFISGVFTGNWSKAWQGIVDIFGGIFSTLGAILKAPLNAVIGLINGAIDNINTISIDIPDWVPGLGGKHFGVNVPKIPMLAKGGFTSIPSICGEAGPEAVIPLKKRNPRSLSLLSRTAEKLGVSTPKGNSGPKIIYAPQIHGSSKEELKEILDDDFERFKAWADRYFHDKAREEYA